jgi:hypothetical protein
MCSFISSPPQHTHTHTHTHKEKKLMGVKYNGPPQIHLPRNVVFRHRLPSSAYSAPQVCRATATSASSASGPQQHFPSPAQTVHRNWRNYHTFNSRAPRCCGRHSTPSPLFWSQGAVVQSVASEDISKENVAMKNRTYKKWGCYLIWRWGLLRKLSFLRTNAGV